MCQLCDFKRDMHVVQAMFNILETVDFENFLNLTKLVEDMVYTIEEGEFEGEIVGMVEAPEDCDIPFVKAMRMLTPIVEMLSEATTKVHEANEIAYDILSEGLDSIGSSEEDEYPDPPTAFTDFFKGDDEDE